MTIYYNYTNDQGRESLAIHGAGISEVVPASHPRFRQLFQYLRTTKRPEPDHIRHLLDAPGALMASLRSERVTFDGTDLRFDGEVIDSSLARHIVRMMRTEDEDYARWMRFMENLSENPSTSSREHLFSWLARRDFAITPEGHLLGYKGVQANGTSLNTGTAFVNGVKHTGHIPNPVGATVEMPRSCVSDDRETGCATGLHVGTHGFASGFGSRLLLVSVNPADVVSVPRDSGFQKMRVSRYLVLSEHTGQPAVPATSFDPGEEDKDYAAMTGDFYFEDDGEDDI